MNAGLGNDHPSIHYYDSDYPWSDDAENFDAVTEYQGIAHDVARYLEIARCSFNEVQDCLHGAVQKRYVSPTELGPARQLVKRLAPALSRFIADLRRRPDPPRRRRHLPTNPNQR